MSRHTLIPVALALALAGCGSSTPSAHHAPAKAPGPVFARSVTLLPIGGAVQIQLPGGGRFTALAGARVVPVGTVVDTRRGDVELTAALPQPGRTDVGEFMKGVFRIRQSPGDGGLADLVVLDQETVRAACGTRRVSSFQLGLLLGQAHSGFRTDGEFAAATVRGTKWGVRNRCDGTLTIDREGVVVVTVFHPHRVLTLHTGQTFLAKAP